MVLDVKFHSKRHWAGAFRSGFSGVGSGGTGIIAGHGMCCAVFQQKLRELLWRWAGKSEQQPRGSLQF
ncbi:hypothetical protein SAMN05414139_02563 [Burkholderia sp. D7]|nr:hypothetical protein SAMN05414139_02563 [Burkholderia sp. D7]